MFKLNLLLILATMAICSPLYAGEKSADFQKGYNAAMLAVDANSLITCEVIFQYNTHVTGYGWKRSTDISIGDGLSRGLALKALIKDCDTSKDRDHCLQLVRGGKSECKEI